MTTFILLIIGTPLAWWLSNTQTKYKTPIEAVVALPLVLPPTVLGFYLLVALSPEGIVGQLWSYISDDPLTFSFSGIVIGSAIYSLPFSVALMIGGNIPGITQVLSITIYDHVEALEYSAAHIYSAALLIFSFVVLLIAYMANRKVNIRL